MYDIFIKSKLYVLLALALVFILLAVFSACWVSGTKTPEMRLIDDQEQIDYINEIQRNKFKNKQRKKG